MTDNNNALNQQPPNSVNVNSLAQQYINNNGYSMQSPPMQRQQQPQQQPLQPMRESYLQTVQDVYRMPQWNDPQRVIPQMQQWPQVPPQPLLQSPTRDEIIQLQQQPEWPVRPILPVVIPPSSHASNVAAPSISKPAADLAEAKKSVVKQPVDSDEDNADSDDDESDRADEQIQPPTEPPKKKQRNKHRKVDKTGTHHEEDHRVKEQMRRINSDMKMEFMDHDGAAERPGGAVLSLTLGKHSNIDELPFKTII